MVAELIGQVGDCVDLVKGVVETKVVGDLVALRVAGGCFFIGCVVGNAVRDNVGAQYLSDSVGSEVRKLIGAVVTVGTLIGGVVGKLVGDSVGGLVGDLVDSVGFRVGFWVGLAVGTHISFTS